MVVRPLLSLQIIINPDSPYFHSALTYDAQEIALAMDIRELPFNPLCYFLSMLYVSISQLNSSSLFNQYNLETDPSNHLHEMNFVKDAFKEASPTSIMTTQRIQDQPSTRLSQLLSL